MGLKLCILASGSSGNCVYVGSEQTRILIDAGLSGRETARRLDEIGEDLGAIQAVCLTHEHSDHKVGLGALYRRVGSALYANAGTIEGLARDKRLVGLPWNVFSTGSAFEIGELRIEPFSVPHDSYDPVGFIVTYGAVRVGIVTDMGIVTALIRERLRHCQVVVIEANHDEGLLRDAERPWSLKQRISGIQGHLSNTQAGELAAAIAGPELQTVFLAHLSSDCNRPELALATVGEHLRKADHGHIAVKLTYPDRASDVVVA